MTEPPSAPPDADPAAQSSCTWVHPGETTPTILVVDDVLVDQRKAGGLIEQSLGWRVIYAADGRAALDALERDRPRIVLTDLLMPRMNGLELVEEVKKKCPLVPVVLMTAFGSEDIAIQALRQGAASYVPKKRLASELAEILEQVLAASGVERHVREASACLTNLESHFRLGNDPATVRAFVTLAQRIFIGLVSCDDNTRIRLTVALDEALANALYHGNLEVGSHLRERDHQAFCRLAEERRHLPPYRDRCLDIDVQLSPSEITYVIRDEGPGFDAAALPDPTDPANLEKPSGRGLLLIRTFMDRVSHNEAGNQITMIWKKG
jgi:CheY-like chemotaxis protein/anti-sigma regulatory factor (Ser/Thr protein kinase)